LISGSADEPWQAWMPISALTWLGLFALMPLFNGERRRVGDLVGGTWVVESPRARLLDEVGRGESTRAADGPFRFTADQLREYGVYELQTLEEVLRLSGPKASEIQREVALRIKHRIRWTEPRDVPPPTDPRPFLEAYYAALRGQLETGMLFGKTRLRKPPQG